MIVVMYENAYEICLKKTKMHMLKLTGRLFEPIDVKDGDYYGDYKKYDFINWRWTWLTSMITGMGSIALETEKDIDFLKWLNGFGEQYREKIFAPYTQTMHDIGFLYLPYSVHLYKLTGDVSHRDTALRAADELCKRFNIKGQFIEAWDEMNISVAECRTIVDSAMNVPLLFWAWKETGHYFYYNVAVSHLETLIRTLVRRDFSVAHAWFFQAETGETKAEANACGYDNGTHWARGTAWLVFGLTIAYDYTKREDFLEIAVKVLDKYMMETKDNPIPVWDFRLPKDKPAMEGWPAFKSYTPSWDESKIENKIHNVDTSAAAIMSCACLLMNLITPNAKAEDYAERALVALCENYVDSDMEITGILTHSNGRKTYSTYGDYYFMLALAMKLKGIKGCWGNTEV